MNTYLLLKTMIQLGKDDIVKSKIDIFLLVGQISDDEYMELIKLIK